MHAQYLLEQRKNGHILGNQLASLKGEATCNCMLVQAASDPCVEVQRFFVLRIGCRTIATLYQLFR